MISKVAITDVGVIKKILFPMDESPEVQRLLELIASEGAFLVLVDLEDKAQCQKVLEDLGLEGNLRPGP